MAKGRKEKPDALRAQPRGELPEAGRVYATPVEIRDFDPPAHVRGLAREVWLEEMPRLRDQGLLKASDLAAFATYCQAAGRHRTACAIIEAQGMTYVSESKHGSMVRVRPEVAIAERAERIMRSFMSELAATSASRIRQNSILASRQPSLPMQLPEQRRDDQVQRPAAGPIGMLN